MNHHIMLFPLLGMEFDGRSIRFGHSRAQVECVFGAPERTHGCRSYYHNSELALDFDAGDSLEFIEFLGGPDGQLRPGLYGHPVFQTGAEEILNLLKGRGAEIVDEDGGYTCTVPALSVGLYREITPADVEEMVREMSRIDLTNLGHVDLAGEQKRARHWMSIGIGRKDYYA